ncbi:hypothetical protein [Streptomyces meridianus]|uniref:Uncharacterized protein n=1 Tax=Streptomyces meridianus TaxID=2938945 RepID=A0ABT0XD26_9ACTN|nr:hypothetical protein [Streptomyces meridianus]MCM2580295.1 hypothetical protein [Streptomyces meridianus]
MSSNQIAAKRTARRTAVALATGAMVLGLAAVPAAAAAVPAPAQIAPAPVRGDVAVRGGATTFSLPAAFAAELKAQGLALAWVDAQGNVRKAAADAAKGMTLGIKSGTVAASGSGQAAGRLAYTDAGFAVVNTRTDESLRITHLAADLGKGEMLASVNGGSQVVIGHFERPTVDSTTVDLGSRVMTVTGSVRLDAAVAQRANEAVGAKIFAADKVAFDTRTFVALDGQADLQQAFGLKEQPAREADSQAAEPGVEAGADVPARR